MNIRGVYCEIYMKWFGCVVINLRFDGIVLKWWNNWFFDASAVNIDDVRQIRDNPIRIANYFYIRSNGIQFSISI